MSRTIRRGPPPRRAIVRKKQQKRSLGDRLIATYATLAAFPEVPDTLRRLRAAGVATAILSNGTPAMLARLVEAARIADCFDHLISVEEVGAFKPSPKVYQRAVDRLALRVSDDPLDHAGRLRERRNGGHECGDESKSKQP